MKFFRTAGCTLCDHKKVRRNFGKVESRISGRETKNTQIKLAATCSKNEHQQDASSNAGL